MSEVEREWFRLLLTVQGVGSKVALAVLGTLNATELASAIALQDKAMIARTPGVGPKVAARIAAELKDRAPGITGVDMGVIRLQSELGNKSRRSRPPMRCQRSSISAMARCRPPQRSPRRMREAGEGAETARLIRLGLKELAR